MSTATVVANGKLTRYHGVNYLLMSSFEILPAPKPVGDAKPKADANEKAAVSPVADLVKEGVAARYERKDIAAAEKAWEQALALLDQPGVTPMDRYQVYAGLGLIFAERQVFAKAKVFFQKAVAASRDISDNRKPLSYSHYNQACAEALLGEAEASLASLRAALEAERLTDRRRYGKMAGRNASFAALKDDPRFKAILKEFTDPAVTAPTGSKS